MTKIRFCRVLVFLPTLSIAAFNLNPRLSTTSTLSFRESTSLPSNIPTRCRSLLTFMAKTSTDSSECDDTESSNVTVKADEILNSTNQTTANMDSDYDINSKNIPPMAFSELGDFDPSKKIPVKREVLVGNPQQKILKEKYSVTDILTELAAIQQQGPKKYCILGTRHCSFLHQQIIELL